MAWRLDPEDAALIEARILQGDSIAAIARDTGIAYQTVRSHANRAFELMRQRDSDYRHFVLEAYRAYWEAIIAQVQLTGDRDWLIDFPKEKFAELHTAIANQGFKFLSVIDFSDEDTDPGGTGPEEVEGSAEPLDGEFVDPHPQLPAGDGLRE